MSTTERIPEGEEYWKRVEIMRSVAWRLEDMLRERLKESDIVDVECGECFGRFIRCKVGRKFMEISEVVAEGFGEYCEEFCEEEGLSGEACDSACEEEFYRLYEEELGKVNEESAIEVDARISSPLFDIEISPLYCDGDYCIAGAEVVVKFKENIENLADSEVREYRLRRVAEVVATILREL
jgi:hypothetical protein